MTMEERVEKELERLDRLALLGTGDARDRINFVTALRSYRQAGQLIIAGCVDPRTVMLEVVSELNAVFGL